MEKANDIIKKIFDIEKSAAKMMDAAEDEKKYADDEYRKKIVAFDEKLTDDYQHRYENGILEIDKEINNEKEAVYNELENEMKELSARYEEKKDVWIEEMFKEITGV